VREKRERVKKGSGSSVNKRGRDVRWRRGSVGEKKESAAKQSNELMCQCVRVTALSFIYIECVHKVSNTVIYAYVENEYRGRFCTHKHTQNTYISAFMLCIYMHARICTHTHTHTHTRRSSATKKSSVCVCVCVCIEGAAARPRRAVCVCVCVCIEIKKNSVCVCVCVCVYNICMWQPDSSRCVF
jgi:hypothetical protein